MWLWSDPPVRWRPLAPGHLWDEGVVPVWVLPVQSGYPGEGGMSREGGGGDGEEMGRKGGNRCNV